MSQSTTTRTYSENASAIRKREYRNKKKLENKEEYLKKNAENAKAFRKAKKDKMLNVSSPTSVGAGINLKEIRLQAYKDKTQAIDEVSMAVKNILTQMYKDGLENIQMPDVVQRVQAELETIKIHLQKELNVESMAQTLSDISQKETNIKYRVTYKVMLRYIHDLLRLQQVKEKLKTRPEKLDIDWVADNKESITKYIKEVGVALSGQNKGLPWSKNSQRAYFGSIAGIFRRLAGYEEPYKYYSEIHIELLKELEKEGNKNQLSASEKKNIVHWDVVTEQGNKFKYANLKEKSIFSIYVYNIAPRRLQDFSHMSVVNTSVSEADKLPQDRNYCVVVDGKPHTFIYNIFKTFKHYPHQIYEIPAKLASILKDYIKEYKIKDDKPLFPKENGDFYDPSSFGRIVGDVFEKVLLGKRLHLNLIRHSFISKFLASQGEYDIDIVKRVATSMAHRDFTQQRYKRFIKRVELKQPSEKENDILKEGDFYEGDDDEIMSDIDETNEPQPVAKKITKQTITNTDNDDSDDGFQPSSTLNRKSKRAEQEARRRANMTEAEREAERKKNAERQRARRGK